MKNIAENKDEISLTQLSEQPGYLYTYMTASREVIDSKLRGVMTTKDYAALMDDVYKAAENLLDRYDPEIVADAIHGNIQQIAPGYQMHLDNQSRRGIEVKFNGLDKVVHQLSQKHDAGSPEVFLAMVAEVAGAAKRDEYIQKESFNRLVDLAKGYRGNSTDHDYELHVPGCNAGNMH